MRNLATDLNLLLLTSLLCIPIITVITSDMFSQSWVLFFVPCFQVLEDNSQLLRYLRIRKLLEFLSIGMMPAIRSLGANKLAQLVMP
jgi:predicted membrane protein